MAEQGKQEGEGRRRRREVWVRAKSGARHPFLRGMVTHALVERGLSFDDAYAIARALRDRIADRGEITTSELEELIDRQLVETFGEAAAARLESPVRRAAELSVIVHGEPQPFSRGLLARSINAAGVDLDRAYRLVTELEGELRAEGVGRLLNDDLARRVGELLERREDAETAGRYRTVRAIRRLPRPLIVYLGGASGTGKSTLALDLAPLLRIYRINATDSVRQVMRMVFSPAILPALHRSSFELMGPDEQGFAPVEPEPGRRRRRLLYRAYEEQATRVCVGARALVERALAENMSIVVEGIHLMPSLIPFADLEGAAYQVYLMLATLDEETHRGRFLARGPVGVRRTERYLESFQDIRAIQERLLAMAERHDVPILVTADRDTSVAQALRLITGMLRQQVPRLGEAPGAGAGAAPPTLLLFVDGLADRPVRALAGRTPLQAARLPNFDRLAREGRSGLADPVAPGVVPDTASGSLAVFGQSPRAIKRGPAEAIGAGLEPGPDDVGLRGNFATLDERGRIADRRAGRIRQGAAALAAALDDLPLPGSPVDGVRVRVRAGTEHRLAILLQGPGLSSEVAGSDPGDGAPTGPPLAPRPLDPDDPAAALTARVVAIFEQEARRVLADHPVNRDRRERGLPEANAVLTRGAGRIHRLLPLTHDGVALRLACVSGDRTVLGLATCLGATAITGEAMTANLDTDLAAKFAAAREALGRHDLVVLHVKGADIAAHDRRPDLKLDFLERVDRLLGELVESYDGPLRIAVAADHATVSEVGQHAADPVPVLMWGPGVAPDDVDAFDEQSAAAGGLQRFPLQLLVARLLDLSDR
jgi:2,3-bisphosphoglycerate-independent phosphoglycerate mutase